MTVFFVILRRFKLTFQNSQGRKITKKNSNIRRYDKKSKRKFNLSCDLSLAWTANVFNCVLKDMNLQFRSMWDKICTNKHKHSNIKGRTLVISMSRRDTNGSGFI